MCLLVITFWISFKVTGLFRLSLYFKCDFTLYFIIVSVGFLLFPWIALSVVYLSKTLILSQFVNSANFLAVSILFRGMCVWVCVCICVTICAFPWLPRLFILFFSLIIRILNNNFPVYTFWDKYHKFYVYYCHYNYSFYFLKIWQKFSVDLF